MQCCDPYHARFCSLTCRHWFHHDMVRFLTYHFPTLSMSRSIPWQVTIFSITCDHSYEHAPYWTRAYQDASLTEWFNPSFYPSTSHQLSHFHPSTSHPHGIIWNTTPSSEQRQWQQQENRLPYISSRDDTMWDITSKMHCLILIFSVKSSLTFVHGSLVSILASASSITSRRRWYSIGSA